MAFRTLFVALVFILFSFAQDKVDFVCPMDKDVHSPVPGKCPRCGMKLVAGLADPVEYPVRMSVSPRLLR